MCRRLVPLAGGLVLLCTAALCAQEAALEQTFGSGVHSYFSEDYEEAFDLLSQAVEAGSPDPRCYYFRGLCYMQLGREDEAKQDFEKGAELETFDLNRFFHVARSLERIQGRQRVLLEGYRAKARLVALEREQQRRRKRYEAIRQQESRVLQQQAAEASAELPAAPGTPAADAPFGLAPIEPVDAADAEPPAAATPPVKPAPAADDPFSAAPSGEPIKDPLVTSTSAELPLEEGAGRRITGALGRALSKAFTGGGSEPDDRSEDLFGGGPSADDVPAVGHGHGPGAMPIPTDDDPFSKDAPIDDDPFAKDAPADDDPFGDDGPASMSIPADDDPADDPFADDAPPTAAKDDPFADDAPPSAAKDVPADDPFADP